jgi:hypothetical protein
VWIAEKTAEGESLFQGGCADEQRPSDAFARCDCMTTYGGIAREHFPKQRISDGRSSEREWISRIAIPEDYSRVKYGC